jgi:hypothetical protein
MPKPFIRRERLFFVITGLLEGILTALILAAGKILRPDESITSDLAICRASALMVAGAALAGAGYFLRVV